MSYYTYRNHGDVVMKHAEALEQPPFFIPRCHANSFIMLEIHRVAVWTALAGSALGAPKMPPIRPEVLGVFPHGGQRGTDGDLLIRDANGTLLDYCDDYYMFKDPHLVYTFAKAGTYFLRLYGSGETGSENADYRLTAGEMPQVDYAMPSGGRQGEMVEFDLAGVNLAYFGRWDRQWGDRVAIGAIGESAGADSVYG